MEYGFTNIYSEPVTACPSEDISKKAQIQRVKDRLKILNKEMKALAIISNSYRYNSQHLTEMIGNCFVAINIEEGKLKKLKDK